MKFTIDSLIDEKLNVFKYNEILWLKKDIILAQDEIKDLKSQLKTYEPMNDLCKGSQDISIKDLIIRDVFEDNRFKLNNELLREEISENYVTTSVLRTLEFRYVEKNELD